MLPATAPKHHCSRGDLHGGMGQNTSNSVCENLVKTYRKRLTSVMPTKGLYKSIEIKFCYKPNTYFHHNLQINSLQILQCDFLDFFLILSLIVEVYI